MYYLVVYLGPVWMQLRSSSSIDMVAQLRCLTEVLSRYVSFTVLAFLDGLQSRSFTTCIVSSV